MKITICYEEGHAPVSAKCKIYGFGNPPSAVEPGWVEYASYELPDVQSKLIPAIFKELAEYGVSYKDATFASIIPESADVVATEIKTILAHPNFLEIPYKSLTRSEDDKLWIEINRRTIPARTNPAESATTENSNEAKAVLEVLKGKGVDVEIVHEFTQGLIKEIVLKIAPGIRYSQLRELKDELAKALVVDVRELRIEAPIPGSEHVGIEYPNRDFAPFAISPSDPSINSIFHKTTVMEWSDKLPVIAGKSVDGKIEAFDLSTMPHLLVGGSCDKEGIDRFIETTLDGWISSRTPEQVQLILVDSKDRAFDKYAGIPHLLFPTINDSRKVLFSSCWLVDEIENRLKICAKAEARNIDEFNSDPHKKPDRFGDFSDDEEDLPATLPHIVMVIRDYACLKGVEEDAVSRLEIIAARGRAAGIHLLIAARDNSLKVSPGLLWTIPGRIAFKAASPEESTMLIDEEGAENLLGGGDCVYLGKNGTFIRLLAPTRKNGA